MSFFAKLSMIQIRLSTFTEQDNKASWDVFLSDVSVEGEHVPHKKILDVLGFSTTSVLNKNHGLRQTHKIFISLETETTTTSR